MWILRILRTPGDVRPEAAGLPKVAPETRRRARGTQHRQDLPEAGSGVKDITQEALTSHTDDGIKEKKVD